jgi:PIN domain nuclease of toxin-antitoxin system
MILLDTCTFLWIAKEEKEKLSKKCQEILLQNSGKIFISAISAFEIGIKCSKKNLELPYSPKEWYGLKIEKFGVQEFPITGEIALISTELPLNHQDPCDRIIIATAMEHKLTILTPDKHIQKYKKVKTLW